MTPLSKKLGLKGDQRAWVVNYPHPYQELFDELPTSITWLKKRPSKQVDFVHLFVSNLQELESFYISCRDVIAKNGMLWISWPKGSKTIDVNRDVIRVYGLANGLVDVKVASINEYWSGLKFVYRLSDR